MIILGIETSCDETGVALCSDFKILSSFTKTQSIHQQYGGVVPEIASREHEKYLPSITKKVLEDANKSFKDIDAIAVTNGPGLMGSLLSGISFARGLSQALNIPIIPINHLEAHLNSVFIEHAELEVPFINLLVSGGHTQLWLVKNMFEYELLGETLDDACGEAFDKGAKKMNLNYPGGPEIEKLAKNGDMNLINFPRPMINDNTFNSATALVKSTPAAARRSLKETVTAMAISSMRLASVVEIVPATPTKMEFVIQMKSPGVPIPMRPTLTNLRLTTTAHVLTSRAASLASLQS